MMDPILTNILTCIKQAPRVSSVFTVYRGTKQLYLPTTTDTIHTLSSFHSTTTDREVAEAFGRKGFVYTFKVHPKCEYIYMESVTNHTGEYEILFSQSASYLSNETKHFENI